MPPASARDWTVLATLLVVATLLYNGLEAVVSLWAGHRAGSIALVGFGLDSVIEMSAAAVMLWRLVVEHRGAPEPVVAEAERRVLRFVGGTFLALAVYVTAEAGWTLYRREAPRESLVGIVLAAVSLVLMPILSGLKLRAARELGSRALRAEALETLACSWLSLALLLGLGVNAWWGWWWADPLAALAMVPWLLREGLEGLRGESCACHDAD